MGTERYPLKHPIRGKNLSMPSSKKKNTYLCFLCGEFSESGPGFCSVNLHHFESLKLNDKKNGFKGAYQQGGAHQQCIEALLNAGNETTCAVCKKPISNSFLKRASKLAIYVFHKRGCASVIGVHDRCLKSIKSEKFPLIHTPKILGG